MISVEVPSDLKKERVMGSEVTPFVMGSEVTLNARDTPFGYKDTPFPDRKKQFYLLSQNYQSMY